jgi:hypothetical protein
VNGACQHEPIAHGAMLAYRQVASLVPAHSLSHCLASAAADRAEAAIGAIRRAERSGMARLSQIEHILGSPRVLRHRRPGRLACARAYQMWKLPLTWSMPSM